MKRIILIAYLIIQSTLYLLSVYLDTSIPDRFLDYLIIVINFLFGGYLVSQIKSKDSILTLFALLFTLIADTFLVLLSTHFTVAMVSFSFTQIFYFIRIKNLNNENVITKNDLIRITSIIILLVIMIFITIKNINLLILVTTFYFGMLLFNFIDSLKMFRKYPYLSIGLLLFIFCDIFVGLNFLEGLIPSNALIEFLLNVTIVDMVWFFYTPSQVILTLSILLTYNTNKCNEF